MAITKDQLISDLAEACDLQKSDVRALLDFIDNGERPLLR